MAARSSTMMTLKQRGWMHARRTGAWILVGGALLVSSACALVARASHSTIADPPSALHAENVTFASASGSVIHAWFVRGRRGAGAVLLLHGIGSNRSSMRARALFLQTAGFTILAPDFQAHGESSGEAVTYGARESLDATAAMQFLRDSVNGERIGVIGVSMGGAASLLGDAPLPADAFVLESVYPTIRQAVSNRLGAWLGPIGGVARLFTSPVLHLISSKTGIAETEMQPISRIGLIHAPLLLLAGTDDRYTPLAEAESLFAHAPAPKAFWPVGGADHEDLHDFAPHDYEQRVGDFLTRWLRADRPR